MGYDYKFLVRKMRDQVFRVQSSLSSDGGIFDDLEDIIQEFNDALSTIYVYGGIRFRVYPVVGNLLSDKVVVEAMVEGYFDDRHVECTPKNVSKEMRRLYERLSESPNSVPSVGASVEAWCKGVAEGVLAGHVGEQIADALRHGALTPEDIGKTLQDALAARIPD